MMGAHVIRINVPLFGRLLLVKLLQRPAPCYWILSKGKGETERLVDMAFQSLGSDPCTGQSHKAIRQANFESEALRLRHVLHPKSNRLRDAVQKSNNTGISHTMRDPDVNLLIQK
jgi:hypothetical protein